MFTRSLALAPLAVLLLSGPSLAQDGALSIAMGTSDQYGSYLTDGQGRSLYLFEGDTQGMGDTAATSACMDDCLTDWPAYTVSTTSDETSTDMTDPMASDPAMQEMLGTLEREDGTTQITYNGWPLYYFSGDTEFGQTNGQDVEAHGGSWYLLTAEGAKVGE